MPRKFRLLVPILGPILGLLLALIVLQQPTQAADADAADIAAGLETFFEFADSLAGFQELGQAIPLTGIDPSAEKALDLANLFADADVVTTNSLEDKLLSAVQSANDIQAAIDGADGTFGNVTVVFENVTVSSGPGIRDIDFTLKVTRTVELPISV